MKTSLRFTAIGLTAAFALTGCVLPKAAPQPPAPQPTVTVTAAPPAVDEPDLSQEQDIAILEDVWQQQSASNRQGMCRLYITEPDRMFAAFSKGGGGTPRATFDLFFSAECGVQS